MRPFCFNGIVGQPLRAATRFHCETNKLREHNSATLKICGDAPHQRGERVTMGARCFSLISVELKLSKGRAMFRARLHAQDELVSSA
jgi:hypothetical protein